MFQVSKLGKWLPHRLTAKNLADRVRIASQLLERHRSGQLNLDQILTCDEKWILYANVIRRKTWVNKGTGAQPTPRPGLHPKKIMLSAWWDTEGVVYWELLPLNSTINSEIYCEQLERVQGALRERRPNREKVLR